MFNIKAFFLLSTSWLSVCSGQFFPQEVRSLVNLSDICAEPFHPRLNSSDGFQFTLYSRRPFTAAPQLENSKLPEKEAVGQHKDLLHRIYARPLVLTRNQLKRSISSPGKEDRLQKLLGKLVSGEAVTVVVLGGSISLGHGTKTFENAWNARVFKYINDTFPHPDHKFLNLAIAATTSSFVAPCTKALVPEGVDLILLEFTLNDSADEESHIALRRRENRVPPSGFGIKSPARLSMERLIRKLMTLPSLPAIINLHSFAGNRDTKFYAGVEDYYTTIATYYGVTALSVRDALHDLIRLNPDLRRKMWVSDLDIHPSCVGTRFMADIVIGFLMGQAATAAWLKHTSRMHNVENRLAGSGCVEGYNFSTLNSLPPPLFEGSDGNMSTDCILDDRLQNFVSSNQGFEWVGEYKDKEDPKWGFISHNPGSQLAFKVPLGNITFDGKDVVIGVGILMSHSSKMGVAALECEGGCECTTKDYNTHVSQSGWSMIYWRYVRAKVHDGSSVCMVKVTDSQKTFSEGHKIKVCSLLVSGETSIAAAQNAWWEIEPGADESGEGSGISDS